MTTISASPVSNAVIPGVRANITMLDSLAEGSSGGAAGETTVSDTDPHSKVAPASTSTTSQRSLEAASGSLGAAPPATITRSTATVPAIDSAPA